MKKLLELGNDYAANSDWTDFALAKFCLCAMGILIGIGIPEGKAKMLDDQGYNDKDIVFGIRPEDIHSEQAFLETWPDAVIDSTVVVSELLGATIQLYQKVDGTEFVADVNSRDYHKPGDHVKMGFDVNKAHFFDKDSTMAIYNN